MDNSFEKLINRVLDNRYKIENVVGIGGMAYVLKAVDLKNDNRPVAIKILNEEFNSDESAVKRFVNESEAVSMVDSPNIVKIYDVAMSESLKYIVMEFIDGITLKDYIDKVGALGWKEAVHYVRQILSALSHAHDKGIVHRDIKPQNVMLLRDGKVKVTDFGIAKTPTSESLTMTDKAIGTVNYISPEQASGGNVDEKSDLYSVGVMLYEMLTGVLPFKAESPVAVAMMQVNETPVQPREINPQIPIGLEQIVLKSMSKKPEDRFNCAASMEKALEYFTKNPGIIFSGVSSVGSSSDVKKTKRKEDGNGKHRSMFPIILGVTLSFFVVCIGALLYLGNSADWDLNKMFKIFQGEFQGEGKLQGDNSGLEPGREYPDITVEEYVGEMYTEELIKELEAKGYVVKEPKWYENKNKPHGMILNQTPEAGAVRKNPAIVPLEVTFYVNRNPEEAFVMPECIGYDVSKIKSDILRNFDGIITDENIVIIEEYNEDFMKETIYDCSPIPGTAIDAENVPTITLYVSKGSKPVEVLMPDVVGLHRSEAGKILDEENILFTTVREASDEPVNTVIRTSVVANTTFMNDVEVVLYISGSVSTDDRLRIPNCTNMTRERAKSSILARFDVKEENIKFVEEYSSTVAKGNVIKTHPESGQLLIINDINRDTVEIIIYVSKGPEPVEVTMPDIIGLHRSEAREKLEEAGILFTEEREYSAEPENTVVKASRNADDVFMSDEEIVVYISERDPKMIMPDCIGDTRDTALSKIAEQYGINAGSINVVEEYSDDMSDGRVIRTYPSAGELVEDVENTNITVYVSKGSKSEPIVMPDVVGYTYDGAVEILEEAGISNIAKETVDSDLGKNTVVYGNYDAGDVIDKDTEVILYVSNAAIKDDGIHDKNTDGENDDESSENEETDEVLLDMAGRPIKKD